MSTEFCEAHIKMIEDIGEIKKDVAVVKNIVTTAAEGMIQHIEHGSAWRLTIAGIAATVIIAIVGFSFWCGRISERVEVNTEKLKTVALKGG